MVEIIHKHVLHGRIYAEVQGTETYSVYISNRLYEFSSFCTCLSYHYNSIKGYKFCKHCKAVLVSLTIEERMKFNMTVESGYMPSSLDGMNKYTEGYPIGALTAFTGPPKIGKSILADQETVFRHTQTGKNALIINTEQRDDQFQVKKWVPSFNKRFKTNMKVETWILDEETYFDVSEYKTKQGNVIYKFGTTIPYIKDKPVDEPKIIAIRAKTLFSLLLLCGLPSLITISDGGQQVIKPNKYWNLQFKWRTELANIVKDNNIGSIVLDSLSNPVKNIYSDKEESFPNRAKIESYILSTFDWVIDKYNIPCWIVHHTSKNPRMGSYTAYGGGIISHTHKFEWLFKGGKEPVMNNSRYPEIKPMSIDIPFQISDKGVFDRKPSKSKKKKGE